MAYGVRYRGEWRSPMRGKRHYIVEIAEDGYTGTSVKPLLFTGDVLTIAYGERDDSELKPIKSSQCELTILCTEDGNPYTSLYTLDPWKYKLSVSENTGSSLKTIWQGYLATGDYSQPIAKAPYSLRIRANDGLGLLKTIDYLQDGEMFSDTLSLRDLIIRLLTPISEFMGISIWPADKVYGAQSDDTYDIIGISDSSIYTSFDEIIPTYYDVLEGVLESVGVQLFQDDGKWCIRSIDRLASAVRASLITPIPMSINTDGLGMSSAGTLSMLPPVNSISSQNELQSNFLLDALLNRNAWQFTGLGKYLPKIDNYTKDSLRVFIPPPTSAWGMAMTAVNILPETIHMSATTEIDISVDLYNGAADERNIAIGVWLVAPSIGNKQLVAFTQSQQDYLINLSAPCFAVSDSADDGWARVSEGVPLPALAPYFTDVKLNKGKIVAVRPSLSVLEKQSVSITLPNIPEKLHNDYFIRDWRIAVVLTTLSGTAGNFYMSSPKVTIRSSRESNVADKVAIAGNGIDALSTSTRWGTVADLSTVTSLSPQLINISNRAPLYGYMVPRYSKSTLEYKGAMVKSLRADTTIELEGVVDKRKGASLNSIWNFDNKFFYAPFVKHNLRTDLFDVQLREMYSLNVASLWKSLRGDLPASTLFSVGRSLYYVTGNKLYLFDSILATRTLIEDMSGHLHYECQGVDCFVVVKVTDEVPTAIAYGEDGEVLAELTRDDSDAIGSTPWGRTIVYDARNELWLATDKVGGVNIYDKAGFIIETYLMGANLTNGNIRPYSDGFIYVSETRGSAIADWHSYSMHNPGAAVTLSGIKQNVVDVNDSAIIAYDNDASEYIAYVRRGVDLRDNDIVELGVGNNYLMMNCALILLRTTSGDNRVYDMRAGEFTQLTLASSNCAALANDSLCVFGRGQIANLYNCEIIIPIINSLG